jgi:hypothetical protein
MSVTLFIRHKSSFNSTYVLAHNKVLNFSTLADDDDDARCECDIIIATYFDRATALLCTLSLLPTAK